MCVPLHTAKTCWSQHFLSYLVFIYLLYSKENATQHNLTQNWCVASFLKNHHLQFFSTVSKVKLFTELEFKLLLNSRRGSMINVYYYTLLHTHSQHLLNNLIWGELCLRNWYNLLTIYTFISLISYNSINILS